MKKILFTSIFALSMLSIKAQDLTTYDNLFFTNLFARGGLGSAAEQPNYHLSNTNVGFGGQWGLDVKWFGGIKLKSADGGMYLTRFGNVGIYNEDPSEKLDVNGNVRINARNDQFTFLSLGHQANDQLIVDNSAPKYFGGGYFFRVHNDTAPSNYIDALIIDENGNIGIGINPPQYKLDVNGKSSFSENMKVNAKIEAKEVKVTQTPTADFVFEENYGLPKLEDVEKHIKANKHLPEIASAKEMEREGVNIGEFQIKLLQKIEELTLYSIEQNKQIKDQSEKIKNLEFENQRFKTLLERIEILEQKSTDTK